MEKEMNKMRIIFSNDEMGRITPIRDGYRVDLHGKTRKEAKTYLNNIIALVDRPFKMDVIHGYNRGTALKTMLRDEKINSRIIERTVSDYNQGQTFLTVA